MSKVCNQFYQSDIVNRASIVGQQNRPFETYELYSGRFHAPLRIVSFCSPSRGSKKAGEAGSFLKWIGGAM